MNKTATIVSQSKWFPNLYTHRKASPEQQKVILKSIESPSSYVTPESVKVPLEVCQGLVNLGYLEQAPYFRVPEDKRASLAEDIGFKHSWRQDRKFISMGKPIVYPKAGV